MDDLIAILNTRRSDKKRLDLRTSRSPTVDTFLKYVGVHVGSGCYHGLAWRLEDT